MNAKYLFLTTAVTLLCLPTLSKPIATIKAPNAKAKVCINANQDGALTYTLNIGKTEVITDAHMGFQSAQGTIPASYQLIGTKSSSHNSVWHPIWGKRSAVKDCYNETTLTYTQQNHEVRFEVRMYDDGMAWRCVNVKGADEWTEQSDFNFAADYTAWYYNGERHNIGPELLTQSKGHRRPVMTIQANNHLYMAIHEACLYNGKPMVLSTEEGSTRFHIVSEPTKMDEQEASAWRVVMFGEQPGTLVDSHLIELLNPEAEGDYSWVRPGIHLWDWRIDGAIWQDYRYRMNYDSWTRMIDFAAEQGFSALVLDANWYGPEFAKDSDPVKGDKARDVQRIIQYGKQKGVGVWLYLNDVAGSNYPIEQTLEQYEQWGAAGVKYGFMGGNFTEKNKKTINITRLCAKHHLCVDFHDDPVHPWGQARTYPNALTREYNKAQLDGHDIFYPKTFVTSVFVNMIAGPLDQNNGMFDLRQGRTTRKDNNQEVPSTVTSEAARTMIVYSGATVIPDIPEYYHLHPYLLEFLRSQKQPWMESKTLGGEIGKYIVMMRQANDGRYLVAAATNEEARTLQVDLSFLPKGEYTAKICEDGPDAHYLTNRQTTSYRERSVQGDKHAGELTLTLAPGGGACVIFEKK